MDLTCWLCAFARQSSCSARQASDKHSKPRTVRTGCRKGDLSKRSLLIEFPRSSYAFIFHLSALWVQLKYLGRRNQSRLDPKECGLLFFFDTNSGSWCCERSPNHMFHKSMMCRKSHTRVEIQQAGKNKKTIGKTKIHKIQLTGVPLDRIHISPPAVSVRYPDHRKKPLIKENL